jgi:hypothetical protein
MAELDLDLVLQEGGPRVGVRMPRRQAVTLRFRAVENTTPTQLGALLFRRRLKPVGEFVDQVMSVERTSVGWTLRFRRWAGSRRHAA